MSSYPCFFLQKCKVNIDLNRYRRLLLRAITISHEKVTFKIQTIELRSYQSFLNVKGYL